MRRVEVRDLSFSYDGRTPVIENVTFQVEEGEFVGIIGPNGSGKTTLIKLILGLIKPEAGSVLVSGRVGYVPQSISTDPGFPGTVDEILEASGLSGDVIDRLHLRRLLRRRFVDLSGGERRTVLFGVALAGDPEILVLDEPTAGVDTHTKAHISAILKNLKGTKTVLMVSHEIGLVLSMATKVLCLNRRVHYIGPPEEAPNFIEELFGIGVLR
ncbi:MAG: metal ABC transporter ATP-binding protein [Aquificota bacterium]|nr:metal ABC transporter ATP-binding protein [Aquificota bacterium]